jgi:hypothetical protein
MNKNQDEHEYCADALTLVKCSGTRKGEDPPQEESSLLWWAMSRAQGARAQVDLS